MKDIVLAFAAIIGAIVAIRGLNTWERQLKGQLEYELSRRILKSVFKYRDAINFVRNPMMWANEMPSPDNDEAQAMSHNQIRFYGISKAYQARWEKVNAEKVSLYADLLEAEAIWGDELKKIFQSLYLLENELLTKVRHHIELSNPDTPKETKNIIREIDSQMRDILYDKLGEQPDEFKKAILDSIKLIEQYLKPHLNHK